MFEQLFDAVEVEFALGGFLEELQIGPFDGLRARRLDRRGAGEEVSLKIGEVGVGCGLKLVGCFDFLGEGANFARAEFLGKRFLIVGSGLTEVDFNNVRDGNETLEFALLSS